MINKYTAKKYPFKIYHCYNPEDFKSVVANEKAEFLWIFGHGWRGGITLKWGVSWRDRLHLTFKRNTYFPYCELDEKILESIPSKKFIAQMHCNHFERKKTSNRPLPQLIMRGDIDPESYYVTTRMQSNLSIWLATARLVKDINRTPIRPIEETLIG